MALEISVAASDFEHDEVNELGQSRFEELRTIVLFAQSGDLLRLSQQPFVVSGMVFEIVAPKPDIEKDFLFVQEMAPCHVHRAFDLRGTGFTFAVIKGFDRLVERIDDVAVLAVDCIVPEVVGIEPLDQIHGHFLTAAPCSPEPAECGAM
jgi:hypothetical protein